MSPLSPFPVIQMQTMNSLPLAVQKLVYEGQTIRTVHNVINGAILWDLLLSIPAEIQYIYYPEFKALCRGKNRGRAIIPSLL